MSRFTGGFLVTARRSGPGCARPPVTVTDSESGHRARRGHRHPTVQQASSRLVTRARLLACSMTVAVRPAVTPARVNASARPAGWTRTRIMPDH